MKQEVFEPDQYYHIFNRGNNKECIFKEEANYSYFLQLMKKYLTETCIIYCYCLLPNHFHLLIKIKDEKELPRIYQIGQRKLHQPFSNFFNSYTKSINKIYNRSGSLFQEHLHRIKIDNVEYLRELVLYIHLNPEKHNMNHDFSKYDYSSYKAYLSEKPSLLAREEILNYFDNESNFIHCHQARKMKVELLKEIDNIDN